MSASTCISLFVCVCVCVCAVEQDIFGLDGVRLLLLHREVVGEDEVDLSRAMLLRHAHIQLRCGLADAHMYLMRRSTLEWALDHMCVCTKTGNSPQSFCN